MGVPWRMQLDVLAYILRQKLARRKRFPLVLMLEPLFACNLECAGCGKIQHPVDVLRRRLSPEESWEAAEECGAPVVSIAGGEPLIHPEIGRIVEGLIARRRYVYLCTNALLLEKKLELFRPSSRLILSIHLDGARETHDRLVCREGVHAAAVQALRAAKAKGFRVMTNTTVFQGEDPGELRRFLDETTALGVDGMMISPGYAYSKAPRQEIFMRREQTRAWFREALGGWRERGWPLNHTPFYLDFLEGSRDYECTPWGNPLRNVFGWQKPCYMMAEAGYAASYRELLETTDWPSFGFRSGNPACAQCMTHCGYEPSAVLDGFSSPGKFLELARDVARAALK